MRRYYLHIQNDTSFTRDLEGVELNDLSAACAHAERTIGEIISEELTRDKDVVHLTILIDDAEGIRSANINAVTKIVASVSPFTD